MDEQIFLSQPQINGREMDYINKAFSTNNLTLFGDNIVEFESKVAEYTGVKAALATNSGTSAIHLGLRYAGVTKGDIVFCSSMTFVATCNPVLYQGATPVFIDCDEDSWNMSPEALKKAFKWAEKKGKLPKAGIVVDIYGQPADYDKLLPIFKKYDIKVVEDATEAMGSTYKGKQCGTFGDYGAFSFNSNKIITTGGGGMVISDDFNAIEKMRYWSAQAREPLPYYEHKETGYQYRMSNILAGIGCAQMESIGKHIEKRKLIYERYKKELKNYPLKMMEKMDQSDPNCWLSVVIFEDKNLTFGLIDFLNKYKIESRMAWKPMHLQPVFEGCKYFKSGEKDVSKSLFEKGVCLPSANIMTDEEQFKVIRLIKEYMDKSL